MKAKSFSTLALLIQMGWCLAASADAPFPALLRIRGSTPALAKGSLLQIRESLFFGPEDEHALAVADFIVDELTQNASVIRIRGTLEKYGSDCRTENRWTGGCELGVETEWVEITVENAIPRASVWNYYYAHSGTTLSNPHPLHQKGTLILNGKGFERRFALYCTYGYLDQDLGVTDRKELECDTHDAPHSLGFEASVNNF